MLPLQPCLAWAGRAQNPLAVVWMQPIAASLGWSNPAAWGRGHVPLPHPLLRTLSPHEQPLSTAWLMGDAGGVGVLLLSLQPSWEHHDPALCAPSAAQH